MNTKIVYPAYRDSGVPWAIKIPEHWRTAHLRYVACVSNGSTPSRDRIDYWTNGTVPWLASGQVNDYVVRKAREFITPTAVLDTGLRLFAPGSVILGMVGQGKTRGMSAYLDIEATINQNLAGITPGSELNGHYLHYMLSASYEFNRNYGRGGNQAALNCTIVGGFKVLLPSLGEQEKIVAYLRAQDARIARFIKGKREIIGLLIEQKLRIIDHAVTRGLDASVKLKPSGIEWLGEVPEHWEMLHIGSSVQVVNGYPFDSERFDPVTGYSLIRIRDLKQTETEVKYNGPEVVEALVDSGDLIIGMDGDFNVARWKGGRALLNQRMCCLRPGTRVSAAYLELVLPKALKFINDMTLSTTVKHLASGDVKRLRFPVPDRDEQDRIVRYVSCALVPIEQAVSNAEEEIKLIREYRDRLIFDVVTGQVDVRGWQPGPDDVVSDDDLAALGDDEIEPDEEGVDDDA